MSKLISYAVLIGKKEIKFDDIKKTLNGSIFRRFQIENFAEHDFYVWISRDDIICKLRTPLLSLTNQILKIDFSNGGVEDVLKGVYQELIDEDTRHQLGEHYTPDWLCERIIRELKPVRGQKILDPACGSGSFLRAGATYLVQNNPDM